MSTNRLYKKFYFLKHVVLFIYVFTAFFEVPVWCLNDKNIKDQVYWDADIYPNSGLPNLPVIAGGLIEVVCLAVLLFFTFFRRSFKVVSYNSRVRELIQVVLSFIAFLDIVASVILTQGTFLSNFIRVMLIALFIRSLRESIKRIVLVVYDSKEIMLLLVAYILLFAWIGTRLFRGTQQGEAYFSSLSESVWNMLILLTTANFPDIMLPSYHSHKAYGLFFIIYLVIGLFFMLNLILATYYSNYKNRVEGSISNFIENREKYIIQKFNEYDSQKTGYLTTSQCKLLLKEFLKIDKNKRSKLINLDKLTDTFDTKCNGKIRWVDLLSHFDIVDVMQIKSQQTNIIKVKYTKCQNRVRRVIKSPLYEWWVCIFIIMNLLMMFSMDWMDIYGGDLSVVYSLFYMQSGITFLFLIEMLMMVYTYGGYYAFSSRYHLQLELFIQIINIYIVLKSSVSDKLDSELKILEVSVICKFMI